MGKTKCLRTVLAANWKYSHFVLYCCSLISSPIQLPSCRLKWIPKSEVGPPVPEQTTGGDQGVQGPQTKGNGNAVVVDLHPPRLPARHRRLLLLHHHHPLPRI